MSTLEKALKERAERKKHKPHFVRQNSGIKLEVGTKYRKPRGYQSKMRRRKAGYLPMPSQGYRAPALVRGLTADGKVKKLVSCISDLQKIDVNKDSVQIRSSVGAKKRIALLKHIQEHKIHSLHDVSKELSALEAVFTNRSKEKQLALAEKEKKTAQSQKEEAKKVDTKKADAKPEEISDEDKAEQQKKEKDKILTDKKTAM